MIGSLTGVIQYKSPQNIILDVQGVGYAVWVNLTTLGKLGLVGESAQVITYLDVKEDSLNLFGFLDQTEYDLFRLLISVSGVGCRSALTILDLGKPSEISQAIRTEQVKVLTQVSGIGKKTAERIILELKDKVGGLDSDVDEGVVKTIGSQDLSDALESLGYTPSQVQRVISQVDSSLELGEQVRMALKLLHN